MCEARTYNVKKLDYAQRRAYVQQLHEAACEVAEGRGVFKDWSELLPGLRVRAAGSHFIFCLMRTGRQALVLAILHERMDLMARLQRRLESPADHRR